MEDLWKEISIVVWFHTTEDTVYCCCSPMEDLCKEISILVWFHTTEDTVYCCSPYGRPMEGNQYSSLISYHWWYSILLLFTYGRPMEGNQYSSLILYHWGYSILLLFALWKEGNQYSSLISYHWGYSIFHPMEDLWKEISIVVWFHTTDDTVYCCCSPYRRPIEGNQYSSLISYRWGYSILLLFALWKTYGRKSV